MKLVYKWTPRFTMKQLSLLEDLAFHTTKLYNIASNWHRDYLHSHTYQQCLKMVEQNWKSFFASEQRLQEEPA
nr:hypothetical protein [Paenibacillus caui]